MSSNRNEYIVGALADDAYVLERTGGKAAVFVNSLQVVQFAVRPISRLPGGYPNIKLFYGFSKDLERHGLLDDFAASSDDRIQGLRDFLSDQLLVFRPSQKGQYFNVADVCLVAPPIAHNAEVTYLPLPIFSQEEHQLSLHSLAQRLLAAVPLGEVAHISSKPADTPLCIVWREARRAAEPWRLVGSFSEHTHSEAGWQFSLKGELRTVAFREDWESGVFEAPNDPQLLFVSEHLLTAMQQELEQAAPYQPLAEQASPSSAKSDDAAEQSPPQPPPDPEQLLLRRLEQVAAAQGLLYTTRDLINFHTAMKTSSLVILTGLSGTGKSRLVQVYGQALGLRAEQNTFIPVRPSWTDDADLFGFVDHERSVYRPGESGLLPTLIQAADNPKQLYLVCLDEMNLARVEHYFSQLLSLLELPPADRKLHLYPTELAPRLFNSAQFPPTILLGDNLLFAGTVNLDESTYHFSDKVLDRANVISLETRPFSELAGRSANSVQPTTAVPTQVYRSFSRGGLELGLEGREIALLWQIHQLLQQASKTLGIGYRVVCQMGKYLSSLPPAVEFTRADALDLQLLQRVFTKIRGPESQLQHIIGSYQADQQAVNNGQLLTLLNEYGDLSPFAGCRNALIQKGRDLAQHGYTV